MSVVRTSRRLSHLRSSVSQDFLRKPGGELCTNMPFDLSVFVMLPRLASQSVRQPRSVRGEREAVVDSRRQLQVGLQLVIAAYQRRSSRHVSGLCSNCL